MIKHFKIFESNGDDMKVLGTNTSYWQWEYSSNEATAEILLDSNGKLYLRITKFWFSSGLGGNTKRGGVAEFENIGTIDKPYLKDVKTLLKKHANDNTRAGHGFSQKWKDEEGNEMSLTELIDLNRPEKSSVELKHIQSKQQFDDSANDIEIVQYSDRAYAIFGMGTKAIKDQLMDLGCRYNKFLTDPKTNQKRPGWICSISKINKVRELI